MRYQFDGQVAAALWLDDANRLDVTQWYIDAELDFALADRGIRCDDSSADRIVAVKIHICSTGCCSVCAMNTIGKVTQRLRLPRWV